jgi:hypothetical protein
LMFEEERLGGKKEVYIGLLAEPHFGKTSLFQNIEK